MGKLIQGEWITDDKLKDAEVAAYHRAGGKFERGTAGFRNWITADGSAGPGGLAGFKAEAGRYHLFAALNCPWAHRTLIYRKVKNLDNVISLSLTAPARTDQGWVFESDDARFGDELYGLSAVHELYTRADADYSDRVTVPVGFESNFASI